jgi:hypothetical protein
VTCTRFSALFLCALATACCTRISAQAALFFQFNHSVHQSSAGDTEVWSVTGTFSDFNFSVQNLVLKTADETYGTTGDAYVQTPFYAPLPSDFSPIRTSASDWTLELQTDAGISKYALHLDLSGVEESSLPQTRILSPSPDSTVSTVRPTISWTSPQAFPGYAQVNMFGLPSSANYGKTLASTVTSYVPTVDLPDKQYVLDVSLYRDLNVPMTLTLLDGPDFGTMDVWSTFEFHASEEFSVAAPEPSCLGLIALCSLLLAQRARSPNRFSSL